MTLKTEDERKFLVDLKAFTAWRLDSEKGKDRSNDTLHVNEEISVRQGYMSLAAPVFRIRINQEQRHGFEEAWLTGKGPGLKKKKEAEAEIVSTGDAEHILEMCKFTVTKTRWVIGFNDATWEVDVFEKKLKGLCVAELENQRMPGKKRLPPWLGREVTKDKRYSNVQLALYGLPHDYRR